MEAQLAEVRRGNLIDIVAVCRSDPAGKEVCGPGKENGDYRVLGRLKPGATPEVASAELTAIAAGMPQILDLGKPLPLPKLDVVGELPRDAN